MRNKGFPPVISVSHFDYIGPVRGLLYSRCVAGMDGAADAWFIPTSPDLLGVGQWLIILDRRLKSGDRSMRMASIAMAETESLMD